MRCYFPETKPDICVSAGARRRCLTVDDDSEVGIAAAGLSSVVKSVDTDEERKSGMPLFALA
jgi:hypothetical protein